MISLKHIMPNFYEITINNVQAWFSYETLIAFEGEETIFVRENIWGNTTGKHINHIKHSYNYTQLNKEDFNAELRFSKFNYF